MWNMQGSAAVGRWVSSIEESVAVSGCDDVSSVGGCLTSAASSDLIDDLLVESFTAQHSADDDAQR